MEKIDILNIPFYKFKVENDIQQDVYNIVQKLEYKRELKSEIGFVYHNFFHEGLFDFFDNSIKQVQNIYFNDDLSFPIVDCWVNKYTTLNYLQKHTHANSVLCGVYYVTAHDNLNTVFETSNPWNIVTNSNNTSILKINKNYNPITGEIKAEAGTLVLFPPSLFHYMKTITVKNDTRYTIAFNTYPSGRISASPTQYLNIKVLSVKEKLGLIKK